MIAAIAQDGVIGIDNRLPWHLPEDLRRFKALTLGHAIVMGRRTWESLGRALPGRRNLVVSRNPHYRAEGAEVFGSLEDALAACPGEEVFVIGGAQLYAAALPIAQRLYLTEIHARIAGDAWFPQFDRSRWRERSRERRRGTAGPDFDFVVYERDTGRAPPFAPATQSTK